MAWQSLPDFDRCGSVSIANHLRFAVDVSTPNSPERQPTTLAH
ncbi:hypothetical protein RRSWK_04979 [Rhodopirellula sp. SWK7]|nr:hypothetical protein RRSWK_04979 [Rhodopirellula sp. SWK7]